MYIYSCSCSDLFIYLLNHLFILFFVVSIPGGPELGAVDAETAAIAVSPRDDAVRGEPSRFRLAQLPLAEEHISEVSGENRQTLPEASVRSCC